MWIFNGYNYFWEDGVKVPPNVEAAYYGAEFLANFNVDIVLVFLPIFIGLSLLIFSKIRGNNENKKTGGLLLGEWSISAQLFCIQQLVFALVISLRHGLQTAQGAVIGFGLLLLYFAYTALIIAKFSKMQNRANPMGEYRSMMKR